MYPQAAPPGEGGLGLVTIHLVEWRSSGSVASRDRFRVLLLIKCLGYGGAERLLVDVASTRDVGAFDYEVAYVLAAEDGLVGAMEATGTPVHCLAARGNWDLTWMAALRRVVSDGGFDLVHSHLPYSASLARLVLATIPAHRRPLHVYTEHSLWDRTAWPVRAANRATIGRDEAVIAVSEAARDSLPAAVRARARVLVHGVDLRKSAEMLRSRDAVRRELRRELGLDGRDVLVTTVANFRREKGYEILFEAVRILAERGVPARFAAVGRGPLRDELMASYEALGLGDRLLFLGERSDVLRILAGSDVFALASHHEGLPVSLMEATSVGLPVVATSVGEIPGVLRAGEDALLVPPGRPGELADAIARMVNSPELRAQLGSNARRKASSFDIGKATAEIEDIYRRLLHPPAPVESGT